MIRSFLKTAVITIALIWAIWSPAFAKSTVMRYPTGTPVVAATQSGDIASGNCVEADANGNLVDSGGVCGGSGSGITGITADSGGTTTGSTVTLAGGLAMDTTRSSDTITFAFDPTELTGNRTWGDGSDASMASTYNLSGTDPIFTAVSGGFDITGTLRVSGALSPVSNDGSALGSASLGWSDLFLATGAVLDFGNGNAVLTHSSGVMTVSTGDFRITTAGSNSASAVTVGGTQTLTNKTLTSPIISVISNTGTVTLPTATDTLVGRATTDTLTNKRITKRVVTAADATSITPNSDNADVTYQANTQAAGTLTINADGGTPTNGQSWLLKIKSTNVQTFSWNAVFVGGTIGLPTTTTGSSKIDNYAFIYDTVNSKWEYTGTAGGF